MGYKRKEIAKRIRNRRKMLGLTSTQVAQKIGRANHYYGDIERGTCGMSIDTLLELIKILEVTADYLLYGMENEKEDTPAVKAYRLLSYYNEKKQHCALELMKCYLDMEELYTP